MAGPSSPVGRAAALVSSRRFDLARPLLDKALEDDPDDIDALIVRSKLYALGGPSGREPSLRDAKRAALLDPDDSIAQQLCGAAHFALGHGNEALSCYEKCTRLCRGLPRTSDLLVDIVMFMTRTKAHLSTLEGAIVWLSEPPKDSIGAALRAVVMSHLGRDSEALRMARSAGDTSCPVVQAATALALLRANRPSEAIQSADKALASLPGCTAVLMVRGKARFNTGQFDSALADFEDARRGLQITKRMPDTRLDVNIAATKLRLGRIDDARTELHRVLTKDPTNAAAWMNMASLNMQTAMPQDAVRNLNRALDATPSCPLARTMRGLAFMRSGSPHLAVNDLYKVCRVRPDSTTKGLLKSALEQIADEHCLYESPTKKLRSEELSAIEGLKRLGSTSKPCL